MLDSVFLAMTIEALSYFKAQRCNFHSAEMVLPVSAGPCMIVSVPLYLANSALPPWNVKSLCTLLDILGRVEAADCYELNRAAVLAAVLDLLLVPVEPTPVRFQ